MGILDSKANFNLDHYINKIVPPSPLVHLPPYISRWLGYRKEHKTDVGNLAGAFWSCVGGFAGLVVIAAVFNHIDVIQAHNPPTYIASFGASAILEYNAIRSPLGQPRNAILGHTFSALIGVAITKLFRLRDDYEKIKWLTGALCCAVSSAVMLLTGTVHPPGGASAVLAAVEPAITDMGWYFVGLVLFGTVLMVIVGLLLNNISRQFPVYWWTPVDLRKLHAGKREEDIEALPNNQPELERKITQQEIDRRATEDLHVSATFISLPDHVSVTPEEMDVLENIKRRLKRRMEGETERPSTRSSSTMTTRTKEESDSSSSAF